MRWYQIKKAALDEKGKQIEKALRDRDIVKRQEACLAARQQHPAQPDLLPVLADVASTDTSETVRREAIRSIGALAESANNGTKLGEVVVEKLFRILNESRTPEVKIEAAWAFGKFGEAARPYLPRLRNLAETATFPALRKALTNAAEELETPPEMADIPLVNMDNVRLNPQLFKLSQGEEKMPDGKWVKSGRPPYLVPGTKLKLRFPGTSREEFSFGTLSRIDYTDDVQEVGALFRVDNNALFRKATEPEIKESNDAKRRAGGKVNIDGVDYGVIQVDGVRYYVKKEQKKLRKPKLVVLLKSGQEIVIDPLAPRVEAWIFKDPEDVPIDKYKGIWVKTSDPMARRVGEQDEDGMVTGLLLKQQGDECIIKIMKGSVPWTIRVPTSSCKPTKNAPVWGTPFATNRSTLGWGDVVSFSGDPSQHYVVEKIENEMATIRPLRAKRGAGNVEAPLDEVQYIGRFEYPSKVVTEPHFSSPAFKQAPVRAPAPDVE